MTSLTVETNIAIAGLATGTTANALQKSNITRRLPANFTTSGTGATQATNVIDKATIAQTLSAGGTVAIDLSSFSVNPFSESAQAFTGVRVIYLEHSTGSSASSISVFAAVAGNSFQGPLSAAATVTLKPGEDATLRSRTTTGWVVDGTHKNFYIVNNDGVNAATIRYFVAGS